MVVRARFTALTTPASQLRSTDRMEKEITSIMIDIGNKIITEVEVYPPKRPRQRYVQSKRLKAAWIMARTNLHPSYGNSGLVMTISTGNDPQDKRTNKRYGAWVHGGFYNGQKVKQQFQHSDHGWANMDEVVKKHRVPYRRKIQGVYMRYAARQARRNAKAGIV